MMCTAVSLDASILRKVSGAVRDNNFPRFFKALLICTASRTAASNAKLKYRTLVAVRLLAVAADNEHVQFSHTSRTRGTS